jgi:hypothetical protein
MHVADWQRVYLTCSERALAALDQPTGAGARP